MTIALVIYLWLFGGILSAGSARFDDQELHWKTAALYIATWPVLVPAVIIVASFQGRIRWRQK